MIFAGNFYYFWKNITLNMTPTSVAITVIITSAIVLIVILKDMRS